MRHYEEVASRLEGDGWIVGRKTMAEVLGGSGEGRLSDDESSAPRQPSIGERRGRSLAIAVDPSGKLSFDSEDIDGDHAVVILGNRVTSEHLNNLRELGVSYVFADGAGGLSAALGSIAENFDVCTLLLEGGGIINGTFLKAGLIDEISVIMVPAIDGLAASPSIFDYPGEDGDKPADGRALRHMSTETLEGGAVWLRYAVEPIRTRDGGRRAAIAKHHDQPRRRTRWEAE